MDTNFWENPLVALRQQGQLPFEVILRLLHGAERWISPPHHHHHHHHGAPELKTVQAPCICQEMEQIRRNKMLSIFEGAE